MISAIRVPEGFHERVGLRSGRIFRDDGREYGVVFSSSTEPGPDDFDTSHLLGAYICGSDTDPQDIERCFQILGGYYYYRDTAGVQTKHVFGVAATQEFGIVEGGTHTLHGSWELDEIPEKATLDEAGTGSNGWTFIVEAKQRGTYPHSEDSLKIHAYCPEIMSLAITFGQCRRHAGETAMRRDVTFRCEFGDVDPAEWDLDFGDGATEHGTGMPPEKFVHAYLDRPATAPTLRLKGHVACGEITEAVDLGQFSAFETCPECFAVSHFDVHYGKCVTDGQDRKRQVRFAPSVTGDAPASWKLEFGDGESTSGQGMPPAEIEHAYVSMPPSAPVFTATSNAPCETVTEEIDMSHFQRCDDCPTFSGIVETRRQLEGDKVELAWRAENIQGEPRFWDWSWNGGRERRRTTEPELTLTFTGKPGETFTEELNVTATGPEDCSSTHGIGITVPFPVKPVDPDPEPPEPPQPPWWPCGFLPLLVAFLMSLTFSGLIVHIAAVAFFQGDDGGWLFPIVVILGVLTIASIFYWYRVADGTRCPRPGKCEWMGISWAVLLASGLIALYVRNCATDGWVGLIVVLLIAAVLLAYAWFKSCCRKFNDLFGFLAASVLAMIIASFLFADAVLRHCL